MVVNIPKKKICNVRQDKYCAIQKAIWRSREMYNLRSFRVD